MLVCFCLLKCFISLFEYNPVKYLDLLSPKNSICFEKRRRSYPSTFSGDDVKVGEEGGLVSRSNPI